MLILPERLPSMHDMNERVENFYDTRNDIKLSEVLEKILPICMCSLRHDNGRYFRLLSTYSFLLLHERFDGT